MANDVNNPNKGKTLGMIYSTILMLIVFSIGFFPLIIFSYIAIRIIPFTSTLHLITIPFLICIGFVITLYSQITISGLFIKIFKLTYEPGVYNYNFKDKTSFKWILVCSFYTPIRKIMEIFPVGGLKNIYYRLLGMKIGKNTLVGGVIKDPCLTSFGENCTMGEYAIIYGHIHDYGKAKLTMDRVEIGNNCIIGAGAIIMPGAKIQDGAIIAAGALVRKGQILEKGKMYAGVPAKEIVPKKKKI